MHIGKKGAEEFMSLGIREKYKHNYQKALEYYNQGIKIDSHNSNYFFRRAWLRQEMQDYSGAIRDFTESIRLAQESLHKMYTYFRRGYVYHLAGNDKRAKEEFLLAIEIYPEDYIAYDLQIEYLTKMGEYKAAISVCNKLIKKYSGAECYWQRGNIYFILKDFKQAIRDFSKVIQLDPNNESGYDGYKYRANAYLAKGNYLEAIQDFTKSIARKKNNCSEIYCQRGDARYHIQDFTGAIEDYTESIKREPNNGHAYSNRGRAYCAANQKKLATEDFIEAAHLFILDKDVENCEKVIKLAVIYRTEADIRHREYIKEMKEIYGN
jgi:tetratricopeptide (TPR) repeat protein